MKEKPDFFEVVGEYGTGILILTLLVALFGFFYVATP